MPLPDASLPRVLERRDDLDVPDSLPLVFALSSAILRAADAFRAFASAAILLTSASASIFRILAFSIAIWPRADRRLVRDLSEPLDLLELAPSLSRGESAMGTGLNLSCTIDCWFARGVST